MAGEIVTLLNQHPNLIWNNRLGGGYKGDTETPEQFIPAKGYPGRDWEACMTMNDTWGYKSYDTNFKSTETLLRNLIDIASKGGNYLLNIGPDSKGVVPPRRGRASSPGRQVARGQRSSDLWHPAHPLRTGGRQLQHDREGQGGQAQVHPQLELALHHHRRQDLHRAFHLAERQLSSDRAFPRTVTSAYLLADPAHKPLKVTQTGGGIDIQLPAKSLDPIATVLVLDTNDRKRRLYRNAGAWLSESARFSVLRTPNTHLQKGDLIHVCSALDKALYVCSQPRSSRPLHSAQRRSRAPRRPHRTAPSPWPTSGRRRPQNTTARASAILADVDRGAQDGPFRPDWNSLSQYKVPDWYRDAKFGIFIHWGVYSVPAFGSEWYPRQMYLQGSEENQHHVSTYGPLTKFGYKDFIPMFKAQKYDPQAWAQLFKESGARYVVPVFEHHDGFQMYDSNLSDWTAVKMGPHRDLVGDLEKAVRAQGLYFGASSHRIEHDWFMDGGRSIPSDVNDPQNASFYGPAQIQLRG